MAQFKNFIPPSAVVWRDGERKVVDAKTLVPGDVVEIQNGLNIPADVVLIKVSELKVNQASLTGESKELSRSVDKKEENIFESSNVAFFGTQCTAGSGTGLVFKTGDNTVIGQIANLVQSASSGETPIGKELDYFIKLITTIAVASGVFFFIVDFIYGYTIQANIGFMIGIIVANVPEGLLITVTVCMALAAQRMAARRVLVKNL
jgi:sodium/potassium-transporting ATPase subunit alpha